MKAKKAYEILKSIQDRQDITISNTELDNLVRTQHVAVITDIIDIPELTRRMEGLRDNYTQLSEENHRVQSALLLAGSELSRLPTLVRAAARFGLGRGTAIIKNINGLKAQLEKDEGTIVAVRNEILAINTTLEQQREAVQVDGHKVRLLPAGKGMITEIAARPRFFERDFDDILRLTSEIDETCSRLLRQNEIQISAQPGVSFWLPYLVNLNSESLATYYRALLAQPAYSSMDEGDGDDEEELVVDAAPANQIEQLIMLPYHGQNFSMWRSIDQGSGLVVDLLYKHASFAYEAISIANFMDHLFSRTGRVPLSTSVDSVLAGSEASISNEYEQYMTNLERILSVSTSGHLLSYSIDQGEKTYTSRQYSKDEACAILLLALSRHAEQYLYFLERLDAVQYGKEVLAAMATLFPWDAEETWAVLLRVESNILKMQSAKFVPEALQYAMTIASNPTILSAENGIPNEEVQRWIRFVIPAIQAAMSYVLDAEIAQFIQERPVAYITGPITSGAHYHHAHHHVHHFGHYHHTG